MSFGSRLSHRAPGPQAGFAARVRAVRGRARRKRVELEPMRPERSVAGRAEQRSSGLDDIKAQAAEWCEPGEEAR